MTRPLLLLLVLTACAPRTPGAPPGPQAACEAAAYNDPVVQRLRMRGLGNPHYAHEDREKIVAAEKDATIACLRRQGVLSGGGVERQKDL